jgi:hypothetical protein
MIDLKEASKLLIGKNKTKAFLEGVNLSANTKGCDKFLSDQYHSLVEEYHELKKKYNKLLNQNDVLKKHHRDLLDKYFDLSYRFSPHNEKGEKI